MKTKPNFIFQKYLPLFLLLLITLAAFWNVQHNDFIDDFDDNLYVIDSPHVNSGLSINNIKKSFAPETKITWNPLSLISHMLDCQLFGLDPSKHHLVNLFFHLINTLLLFIVLKRMTGCHWQSLIVAAFFGLHPLHVESVAWISERRDVLSTFFWILAIWCYAWYTKKPKLKRYLPILFLLILGLLSKAIVVTLPFVFLLLDYWPLNRLSFKNMAVFLRMLVEKIPFLIFSALSSIIVIRLQKYMDGNLIPDIYPLNLRLSNALVSYAKYVYKLFSPTNLSIFYPFPEQLPLWQIILSFILLLTITGLVIRFGTRYKFLPVGWFWYLGTLVPVIGIVRVGAQAMADRYMYIPSIGLFIIIAWGTPLLLSKWRFKIPFLAALSSVIVALLAFTTHHQVKHWSNTITLFEHATSVDKNNVFAHNHLGVTMAKYGLRNETVRYTSEALKIKQNNPAQKQFRDDRLKQTYVKTYVILGKSLLKKDNIDPAIIHFKEALLVDPDYSDAKKGLEKALALQKKEIQEAEKIKIALQQDPTNDTLYVKLGAFYKRRGNLEMAELEYKKALEINPNNIKSLMKLAYLYAIRGRYGKSVSLYQQIITLGPDNPEPYYQIASIYARRRKSDESVSWLKKAVNTGFHDWGRLKKDKSLKTIHGTCYFKALVSGQIADPS